MKIHFEFEPKDKINILNLNNILNHFNNSKTEACFKRRGDVIEVIIQQKETFKDICFDCGIKHFDKKEDYLKYLRDDNYERNNKSFRIK